MNRTERVVRGRGWAVAATVTLVNALTSARFSLTGLAAASIADNASARTFAM
jgi:hypothetical protein